MFKGIGARGVKKRRRNDVVGDGGVVFGESKSVVFDEM
jgi:hypothetical protein